jgi:uncharacterized protein (DUF927 family)
MATRRRARSWKHCAKTLAKCYGAVGREYLRHLVRDRASSPALDEGLTIGMREFVAKSASDNPGSQVERVARRFALVAVAGELATEYGLTGWEKGEATRAASGCFLAWVNVFGLGSREEWKLLEQVRSFFQLHGSSRFENLDGDPGQRIINRCGFYRVVDAEAKIGADGKAVTDDRGDTVIKREILREFLVFREVLLNEVCTGFERDFATHVLKEHGYLVPDSKNTQSRHLPGMGQQRIFVIRLREEEKDES